MWQLDELGEGKGRERQMFHSEILNLTLGLQSRSLKGSGIWNKDEKGPCSEALKAWPSLHLFFSFC